MKKEIVTDKAILNQESFEVVDNEDISDVINDLLDTAAADYENTAGLAAIQIGYATRIFILKLNGKFIPIINPVIVKRWGGMVTKPEACLSVPSSRIKPIKRRRHKRVRLQFNDYRNGARIEFNFKGFTARVIQHEMDHLNGVTI